MDEPRNEAACNALIAEIKKLLLAVGGDEEGLVMTSYESDDEEEGHCYNYELLSLDGLRAGFFSNPEDIPEDEEDLLEAIQEIELEPWETLDEEELTELRDYLKVELEPEE